MTQIYNTYGKIVNINKFNNGNLSVTISRKEYYSKEKGSVYGLPQFTVMNKKLVEIIDKNYKKGDFVAINFRLTSVPYEKDGSMVYPGNQLIIDSIDYLPGKKQEDSPANTSSNESTGSNNNMYSRVDEDPFANSKGPIEVSEDDLPF